MNKYWIYPFLKKYKFLYLISFLFIFIDGYATLKYPIFLTNIIDFAIPNKDNKMLLENIVLLIIFQIISIVSVIIVNYIFYNLSNSLVIDIKQHIIKNIFKSNGKKINKNTSMFMTCMTKDIDAIEFLTSRMAGDVIMDIITLVITCYIVLQIDLSISIFLIFIYPVLVFSQIYFNKKLNKSATQLMLQNDNSNVLLKELTQYMFEYVILGAINFFSKRFFETENKLRNRNWKLICGLHIIQHFQMQ